jgi:hypothetical protein
MKKYVKLLFLVILLIIGTLSAGFGESITLDYVFNGSGTKTLTLNASDGFYVNSWNASSIKVNGTEYTNTYKLFTTCGTYEIVYESSSSYGHLEIKRKGTCLVGVDTTSSPTEAPTSVPTETPAPECGCKGGCDNLSSIRTDFTKDGAGELCFEADSLGAYINSWNMDVLEVNGVNFRNKYTKAAELPAKIDSKYYVYYKTSLKEGHFEAKGQAPAPDPTTPPTAAPTDVPTAAPTDVPTAAPTDVPTEAPTDVPTAAPTDVPTEVPTDVPTSAPTEVPDGLLIPGMIEAEDFNDGGEGVGYHDTNGSPVLESNSGGSHVAYIESGEWLAYTVYAAEGNYYIDVYVASANGGGSLHIEFDDVDVTGVQNFDENGSWTDFIPVTVGPVFISGGEQIMKVGMNGSTFNVDRLVFTETSETPSPSPTPTAVPTPSPVPPAVPQLHTDGIWIRDSSDNAVVLRGVATGDLDAIYKGDRSKLIQTTILDIIDYAEQRMGNVYAIRLCIHPEVNDETGNHGWLHYDPDFYFENIIDPAVQHVISKGMYAIIDWHYVGQGWTGDSGANTEKFWLGSGSWAGIASKYANNPNVIFELFNEPGGGDWNSWKSTAGGWINSIRAKGANNIIIVGGPNWSQVMPKNESELISAENIVYACHIYPSHSGGGMPDWIEYVSTAAPVMMTEWGYENNSDANVTTGTKSSYGQMFRDFVDSKPQVGWIAWCFDYCYRSVMCDMNWKLLGNGESTSSTRYHGGNEDTYDNYMGYFVKDWLYDKRNDYSPGSGGTGTTIVPTDAPTSAPTDVPTSAPTSAPTTEATDAPTSAPENTTTGSFTGDSESNPFMISSPNNDTVIDLSNGYCWAAFGNTCNGMQFNNAGGQFDITIEYNSGADRKNSSLVWSWGPGIKGITIMKIVKNSGYDSCRIVWW